MKHKYYRKSKKKFDRSLSKLDIYNSKHYVDDYAIIGKLSYLNENKLEWITDTRYKLQFSANKYENKFGNLLISKKIRFIHQMPFVISGKIYFLDFYIPEKHIAIEIDGQYHDGLCTSEYDMERDNKFRSIGIKTYRIPNQEVFNEKILEVHLKSLKII